MDNLTSHMFVQGLADQPEPSTSRGTETRGQHTSKPQYGHDALHGVEDQVHVRIASCLRGALITPLLRTDEKSGSDDDVPA